MAARRLYLGLPRGLSSSVVWPLLPLVAVPATLRGLAQRLEQTGPKQSGGVPALRHFVWLFDGGASLLERLLEPLSPAAPQLREERLQLLRGLGSARQGVQRSASLFTPCPPVRAQRVMARARALGWRRPAPLADWAQQDDRCQLLFQSGSSAARLAVALGGALGLAFLLLHGLWAAPVLGAGLGWLLATLFVWWPASEPRSCLEEATRAALVRRRPVAVSVAGTCERVGRRPGLRVGQAWVEMRPPRTFDGEGQVNGFLEGGAILLWWHSLTFAGQTRTGFPRLRALVSPLFVCLLGGCWAVLQWVEM